MRPLSIFGFSGTTSLVYCRQMAGIARRKGKIGKGVSQPLSDVTLSVCFPGLEVWGALGIKSTVFSYQSELSLGVIRAKLLDTTG